MAAQYGRLPVEIHEEFSIDSDHAKEFLMALSDFVEFWGFK